MEGLLERDKVRFVVDSLLIKGDNLRHSIDVVNT